MKILSTVVLAIISFSSSADVIFQTRTSTGASVEIISNAPIKDGGSIKFKDVYAKVEGKNYRILTDGAESLLTEICRTYAQAYPYTYKTAGTITSSEKSVEFKRDSTVSLTQNKGRAVVTSAFCLENNF